MNHPEKPPTHTDLQTTPKWRYAKDVLRFALPAIITAALRSALLADLTFLQKAQLGQLQRTLLQLIPTPSTPSRRWAPIYDR